MGMIQMNSTQIPAELQGRILYGLYGGVEQWYISGVDGTLAQLGGKLPDAGSLRRVVADVDRKHERMMRRLA